MDKILASLLDGIAKGDFLVVFLIIVIALIFNIPNLYRFIDNRTKDRLGLIKESLVSKSVTENTKTFLDRLLEQEYFKAITGINLEKEIREALIKVHKNAKGEVRFQHFKRAIPYIYYQKNAIEVRIGWFSIAGAIYSFTVGVIFVLLALFFLILPVFARDSLSQMLSMYGLSAFCGSFGGVMLLQTLPVISARHVQKCLKKEKKAK